MKAQDVQVTIEELGQEEGSSLLIYSSHFFQKLEKLMLFEQYCFEEVYFLSYDSIDINIYRFTVLAEWDTAPSEAMS